MHKKQKLIAGAVVAVVVIAGGSFYCGMQYEKGQVSAMRGGSAFGGQGQNGGMNIAGSRGSRGMQGGLISGKVVSSTAQSVTVEIATGGSKVVYLSGATQVLKSVVGQQTDLQAGDTVMITGTPNQDGSLVAQSIQIRPAQPARVTPTQNL